MIVKGIHCKLCGDTIWSRHRHDFRWCKCQACFVDGGRDYLRYGGEPNEIEIVDVDTQTLESGK